MRPITIEVKQEHIDVGQPDPSYCPIALAAQCAGLEAPCVHHRIILWLDDRQVDGEAAASLPPEAVAFIKEFDNRRPVQPFEFTIWV